MKILQPGYIPRSVDYGLLLLRLWFAGALVGLHGWAKLLNWNTMLEKFGDPIGVGPMPSLALAIFGEVVCCVLLIVGLFTRFAALCSAVTMFVAFWIVHAHKLAGDGNGELAFTYLGAFLVLLIAGPGKYSLDAKRAPKI